MTVTIDYPAFLMTIVGGTAVAALVYFIVVLTRISRALGRLDVTLARADDLLGSLKTLSEESTVTVVAARHLVESGQRVVTDLSSVSARMRDLAASDASRALSLIERIKSFAAVFAGVRTAFESARHFMERRRRHAGGDTDDN